MNKKTAQNYLTRYRGLDWLYKNKRGKNTAKDYLIRAYILYIYINPSVKKRRLRKSSLIYESLKKKGSYIKWSGYWVKGCEG
jgi:hypothetical protein